MPPDVDRYRVHQDFHVNPANAGVLNWSLQAFLGLQEAGFPCQLVSSIPDKGIIIAHKDCWPARVQPSRHQLFVCIKADRSLYPFAQVHIVQNRHDDILSIPWYSRHVHYMDHFPQAGLIPRRSARGTELASAAYMGTLPELESCFQSPRWTDDLRAIGVRWMQKPYRQWTDYSDVDVVFAVRRFQGRRHARKPATKLVNAWLAGAPAILGPESAYRDLRKSDLDFIEASDYDGALEAVRRLKNDPQLFAAMVENGLGRAREYTREKVIASWEKLIRGSLFLELDRWSAGAGTRALHRLAAETYHLGHSGFRKTAALLRRR